MRFNNDTYRSLNESIEQVQNQLSEEASVEADYDKLFDIAAKQFGAKVIAKEHGGDYQGTIAWLLTKGGKYTLATYHYGSCSGCDAILSIEADWRMKQTKGGMTKLPVSEFKEILEDFVTQMRDNLQTAEGLLKRLPMLLAKNNSDEAEAYRKFEKILLAKSNKDITERFISQQAIGKMRRDHKPGEKITVVLKSGRGIAKELGGKTVAKPEKVSGTLVKFHAYDHGSVNGHYIQVKTARGTVLVVDDADAEDIIFGG